MSFLWNLGSEGHHAPNFWDPGIVFPVLVLMRGVEDPSASCATTRCALLCLSRW